MQKLLVTLIAAMFVLNIAAFVYKNQPKPQPIVVSPVPDSPQVIDPVDPIKPKPETIPEFVKVEQFRTISEQGSVYADVLAHSKDAPFGDRAGRSTNAHETAHGIHSHLRNTYTSQLGKRVNGFYALEGKGVILDEPKMRKSQINRFVPQNLHSYRYNLYLAGQQAWDDTPLYIYDEWVAYIIGGQCCVDDVQKGRHTGGWTDGVSGCLDFSIYAMALAMAVKEHDPAYWESNTQFRSFTIWMLRQAHQTYVLGHKMDEFKWDKQDALLREFLTSSAAEPMRNFVRENLEGVWLDTPASELNLRYEPYQTLPPNEPTFCIQKECDCHRRTP